jgi:formylglycine-generating enzyme required for sulfatase activity
MGLNSCLFAGYDGDDRQKLALGLYQVESLLEQHTASDLAIALMHHPFACLHPEEKVCQNRLMKTCDLILYGHLHEPANAFVHSAAGQAVLVGAGASCETRESRNAFNLFEIDLNTGTGKVVFYKYLPDHNRWKRDTAVNPDQDDGHFPFQMRNTIGGREETAGVADGRLRPATEEGGARHASPGAAFHMDAHKIEGAIQANTIGQVTQVFQGFLPQDETDIAALRDAYLNRLLIDAGVLSLEGIDPKAAAGDADARLDLGAVYTALWTASSDQHQEMDAGRAENRRISVVGFLDQNRHVALLGDPGSGKTTFVNFLSLCMAGELLKNPEVNLDFLTRPISAGENDQDKEKPQPWRHGALIPVRVILRDFAARHLSAKEATVADLWTFITEELEQAQLGEFAPHLKRELLGQGGILLLDGLDEVPEADGRRGRIKAIVEDFIKTFHKCRVLVTSRTYAYQKQQWRIPALSDTVLAPFDKGQIKTFIERWYEHVAALRRTNPEDARGMAARLKREIFARERLRELAERPLLLTLIASLHAWQGGGNLPNKRDELYAKTVDLLLDWWERPKIVRDKQGRVIIDQPGLMAVLKLGNKDRLRRMLNELAFNAHRNQPELNGTADISEDELVKGLWQLSENASINPRQLMLFLNHRAGLLVPRGVKIYCFPHRTFQEYLAACHLTDWDYPEQIAELGRNEPDRWREACLLAGAKAAGGTSSSIWTLAEALCFREPGDPQAVLADAWGARLAGEALVETAVLEKVSPRNQEKLARIKRWLVRIVRGADLPAIERAGAGNSLAILGDDRPEVNTVDAMQFCYVPPGAFAMGEGENEKLNEEIDYGYWIGRYPVTRAQYDAFVAAGGYGREKYWGEAVAAGVWKEGRINVYDKEVYTDKLPNFGSPFNNANHPVVGVSWFEAMAFARWVAEMYYKKVSEESFKIRLPKGAEWEKAARGGFKIPEEAVIKSLSNCREIEFSSVALKPNVYPKRLYPWGETPTSDIANTDKANYDDTAIGATSAVGCFAAGRSPYGCEDQSGNIYEWCMDAENSFRVLAGGSWLNSDRSHRVSRRATLHPGIRSRRVGFRLWIRIGLKT